MRSAAASISVGSIMGCILAGHLHNPYPIGQFLVYGCQYRSQ